MKALVYYGRRDLRYEDFPEPRLEPGDVRVKVKASGLCHTDYNEYVNGPVNTTVTPNPRTGRCIPVVLGHEFCGEVVETGQGVRRFRAGDRVAVNSVDCCGECELCRRRQFIQCRSGAVIGFSRDGGYAEYAVVPESCCYALRSNVSYRAGAVVEPLAVALHSLKRARFEVGSRAAVVGGGTIGLCTLQALRACGAVDVYVIEKSAAKRRYAEELGASEFILADQENVKQVVLERTEGLGVDFAFECAGSGAALDLAVAVTRPGGTVCVTGAIPHPVMCDWLNLLLNEKSITTTDAYTDEFPTVVAMLNDGRLKAETLITTTMTLDAALGILTNFEEAGKANVKMLIEMAA